jgi:hypothetical protein
MGHPTSPAVASKGHKGWRKDELGEKKAGSSDFELKTVAQSALSPDDRSIP